MDFLGILELLRSLDLPLPLCLLLIGLGIWVYCQQRQINALVNKLEDKADAIDVLRFISKEVCELKHKAVSNELQIGKQAILEDIEAIKGDVVAMDSKFKHCLGLFKRLQSYIKKER